MWPTIIAALTSAGTVAIISAVIQAFVGRKKISAEAAEIIDKAASSAVQRSEKEILRMEERLKIAENQISSMGIQLKDMEKQMGEKDRRVEVLETQVSDITEEMNLLIDYANTLRITIRNKNPSLTLPAPSPRIARHFTTTEPQE